MEKKEYLSEENFQKNKKKILMVASIVLVIGLLIGGSLIATGLMKQNKVNSQYSEESQSSVSEQLAAEKNNLQQKKSELELKGIEYKGNAKYTDGEVYDLYIITNVLNPSFEYCVFGEYKNNDLTSKYCSLKNNLDDISSDFNKKFDSHDSIPFYMFGAFVIVASCMIAGSIYMFAKRREIIAFSAQQVMPLAQEGIEKMAPTVGSVAGTIGKEIAKGIKEGLKDEEEK